MKEFTLVVTDEDISIISAGLTELPYKHSAGLIKKLQEQINNQLDQVIPSSEG